MKSSRETGSAILFYANGLGDNLINLPSVRALSKIHDGSLTLLAAPGVAEIFFRDIKFRRIVEIEFDLVDGTRQFDASLAAKLCGPCNTLISLNPWHSNSVDKLIDIVHPTKSIGFFRAFATHLKFNFQIHSARMAFLIPQAIDCSLQIDNFVDSPALEPSAAAFARRIRAELSERKVLAVHADTGPVKMWDSSRFDIAITSLLQSHPELHVLLVGRSNPGIDVNHDRIYSTYGVPLPAALALVSVADVFLGIDSCFLHAADLFRIPGVGLFGPTQPREFGFYLSPHAHLRPGPSMDHIHPAEVVAAVEAILG
jgi:ADP-heptose:LPS heptosyltransferase